MKKQITKRCALISGKFSGHVPRPTNRVQSINLRPQLARSYDKKKKKKKRKWEEKGEIKRGRERSKGHFNSSLRARVIGHLRRYFARLIRR